MFVDLRVKPRDGHYYSEFLASSVDRFDDLLVDFWMDASAESDLHSLSAQLWPARDGRVIHATGFAERSAVTYPTFIRQARVSLTQDFYFTNR